MTTTARDVFIVGLRNAHSMEVQARELMERQSERLGDYPDVQTKVKEHLAETNQQLNRLEQCLEACGETSSTFKDADSGDCGQGFRLNATMHSDRRRPPIPTKAAGVSLPA
jgi:ferritin-like metal-binding protein YciE